jgi:hypothetical protein
MALPIFSELSEVFQRRPPLVILVEDVVHLVGADPAGGALAAGLVHAELQVELGDVHHAVVLVHDDQAAGAHHRAELGGEAIRSRSGCRGTARGMMPPEGPPVWAALNFLPSFMPPPMSKMISRRVVPIGTSTRPELLILPVRAKTLVPLEVAGADLANQAPPLAG